jgi:ABC-type branched-subunit amino acid transport system permease subunit
VAAILPLSTGVVLSRFVVGRRYATTAWTVFGLVLSVALGQLAIMSSGLLGGSNGLVVPRYFSGNQGGELSFDIVFLVSTFFAGAILSHAVVGRRGAIALIARYAPDQLESMGYSLVSVRSGLIAAQWLCSGLFGALFVSISGTVDPTIFGIQNNLTILVGCVLLGERTLVRAACATFAIVYADYQTGSQLAGLQTFILGIFFVVVLWARRPRGLMTAAPHFSVGSHGFRI